jgi:hypothetical protein
MSSFEKLIIGSAHEGPPELFGDGDQQQSTEELLGKRKERGILDNIAQSLESTLRRNGYEQVREIQTGVQYPTVDQWINHRINSGGGTRFFPCFIKDREGRNFFAKVQITDDPSADERLKREFNGLEHVPAGVRAPKAEKYVPSDEHTPALLVTEMIPFSEASVRRPDEWKKEHAVNMATQIKILESQKQGDIQMDTLGKEANFTEEGVQLIARAGETIDPTLLVKVQDIIVQYKSINRTVLVHGDLAVKNVLIGKDGNTVLVDWELSSPQGFLGQDAAKLWSSLTGEPKRALAESYVLSENGVADEERMLALQFGVVIENLVHLAWRNENLIAKGKGNEYSNLAIEIENLNKNIREILSS